MKDDLVLLVVGSGGREFAVAKKLKESRHVKTVYCAPGNVGMQTIGVETVPIEETDLDGLLDFAQSKHVDWTFVGQKMSFVLALPISLKRQGKRFLALTKEQPN
ncbi:MAG: phosphoribosylamine--glycine ligase family protein [Lactobacillus sp.]|nr:phosphoribosylamine--glycine ligase N-terminal domain-containing protein [Lactobacillus sp.]MDN5955294.1 phosphoribosylamine--glycine ligase family protein [Lactobacillus sp.]MDN5988779.1 phosphoribosylamine--glycine ligase family protein [Lactobacillus sp.]MDN6008161.1 phosphoribosylamine--glycine ligase family protein [Lactobacillus sp.]MDN6590053.1 phosphoribosylamine--glycine ligase family protein [Lactobacillus sp.]MDN6652590.1 phosphoribosylamine--glycine ligase family protein [Lactob